MVVELGGRLLVSVPFPLDEVQRTALRRCVEAHGRADSTEFPAGFEANAAPVTRRLHERLTQLLPGVRIQIAWSQGPLASCVLASESTLPWIRSDEGPAALALRTGRRTAYALGVGPCSDRALAIALGACPAVPGAHWSVALEGLPPGRDEDAIEATVLRCALDAVASAPPHQVTLDAPAQGPFRAAALADWQKARTSQELPLHWPATLQRVAHALIALVLASPLLLLVPIEHSVRCNATIVALQRRDIVAPFAGMVSHLAPATGARLRRGELLFRLVGHAAEGEAERVLRDYRTAVAERLLDPSTADGAAARASLQQAQVALRSLAGTNIRAPIDGVLADVAASEGLAVGAGERLATLLPAHSQVELELRLPAQHARRVAVGAPISVALGDQAATRLEARIVAIGAVADGSEAARHVTARARFETTLDVMPPPDSLAVADVVLGNSSLFALLTQPGGLP